MTVPAASVVIPARDAAATLARTLTALRSQSAAPDAEVIVVDDASTDDTRDVALAAGASVIDGPGKGPAAARNVGAAATRAPALVFLDADCFPSEGWLAAGLGALADADLVQGRVLPDPDAEIGPFDRSLWVTSERGLYETANLFVRRETFDAAGGFERWLAPGLGAVHMAEDVLFGWRAKRLGARSVFCAEALAYHAVFPRGPAAYITERRRLRYFPAIAARVPELRDTFFSRRLFLDGRTARFDLALLGAGVAAVLRSPWPLVAAAPYLRALRDGARRGGSDALGVALADLAADATGAAELAYGSLRARSPLL